MVELNLPVPFHLGIYALYIGEYTFSDFSPYFITNYYLSVRVRTELPYRIYCRPQYPSCTPSFIGTPKGGWGTS